MLSLDEAKDILESKTNLKPVAYWIKNGNYIFKTPTTGMKDCSFYIVDNENVIPTNPLRSGLTLKDAKIL